MTIKEYVDNPMGKGDSALGVDRTVLKGILTEKYQRLVAKKKIKANCYVSHGGKQYTVHLVIPSETERDNSYDVVFEFNDPKRSLKDEKSLKDYEVRVFANSPSFAYTFAYVYKKHGLLIEPLAKKLGKQFVKIAPEVRNRYQVVSFEKYIFFGAKYIIESGLLIKSGFEASAGMALPTNYPGKIRTLEEIMKEYNAAEAKLHKKRKKDQHNQKREETQKKKELQQVKSGINTISPKKKTMGHASSNIKTVKKVKNIGGK